MSLRAQVMAQLGGSALIAGALHHEGASVVAALIVVLGVWLIAAAYADWRVG